MDGPPTLAEVFEAMAGRTAEKCSRNHCAVCGQRGNVIICDSCSRVYHRKCLGPDEQPSKREDVPFFCPCCRPLAPHDQLRSRTQRILNALMTRGRHAMW